MTDFQQQAQTNWKSSFENFKAQVQQKGNFIFIQESPKNHIIQITYMHPQITKNMDSRGIRQYLKSTPIHSVSIHVPTKEVIHCFGSKSYVYDIDESNDFVEETLYYTNEQQTITVEKVPFGLVFAARWFQDRWLLGSSQMINANDATFGSQSTLYNEFTRLYGQDRIDTLNKDQIHIFRISSNNYIPFQVKESVQLLETRDIQTGDIIESFTFQQEYTYNQQELREYLENITNQMQDESIISAYEQEDTLYASFIIRMNQYQIQLDSRLLTFANNAVTDFIKTKVRQTLMQFLEKQESEFITNLSVISTAKQLQIEEQLRIQQELEQQQLQEQQQQLQEQQQLVFEVIDGVDLNNE